MDINFIKRSIEFWTNSLERTNNLIKQYNGMLRIARNRGDEWSVSHYTEWREDAYKDKRIAQKYIRQYKTMLARYE